MSGSVLNKMHIQFNEIHTKCFCCVNCTQLIIDHEPPVRNGLSSCSDPDRDGLDAGVKAVAPIVNGRISWITIWSPRVKQRKSCSPGPNSERKKQLVFEDDIISQRRWLRYVDNVVKFWKLNVFFYFLSCHSTVSPKLSNSDPAQPETAEILSSDAAPVINSAPPPPTRNQTILNGVTK